MTGFLTIVPRCLLRAPVIPPVRTRHVIIVLACMLSVVVSAPACPTCTARNDGVMQSLTHGSEPTSVMDVLLVVVMCGCVLWSAIATAGAITGERKRRKQVQQGQRHESE